MLLATVAPSGAILASSANSARLASGCSTTASITSSAPSTHSASVGWRVTACARPDWPKRPSGPRSSPASASVASAFSIRASERASVPMLVSVSRTVCPPIAQTSAMPCPIRPAPTTATRMRALLPCLRPRPCVGAAGRSTRRQVVGEPSPTAFPPAARVMGRFSGSGMNSRSSPGTVPKRPAFQSSFACSIRSREEETKFQYI